MGSIVLDYVDELLWWSYMKDNEVCNSEIEIEIYII